MLSHNSCCHSRIAHPTIRALFIFRHASTACGLYPFPSHRNPTPHEIFHLPRGASQAQIKARCEYICDVSPPTSQCQCGNVTIISIFYYQCLQPLMPDLSRFTDYELVRLYHPDSPHDRSLPHAERTSRFQSFQRAYETLKRPGRAGPATFDDLIHAEIARRRRTYRRYPDGMETRRRHLDEDTHAQASLDSFSSSASQLTDHGVQSDAMAHDVGAIFRGICITSLVSLFLWRVHIRDLRVATR